MNFTGWFQHENFETDELGDITLSRALEQLNSIDWAVERKKFEAALSVSEPDCCPPGLGINGDNGCTFHLCADAAECWRLMLMVKNKTRFLGVIPKPPLDAAYVLESLDIVPKLLELFFAGKNDELVEECRSKLTEL